MLHEAVAEAAVVGYPARHPVRASMPMSLMAGEEGADELKSELVKLVRNEIGPIAKVNLIQWAPGLPKTRSGRSCAASSQDRRQRDRCTG